VNYPVAGESDYVKTADFNNDGILDLVTTNATIPPYNVSVFLGNGDGTFQDPLLLPASKFPYGLAVGDFAGNGNIDIAVAHLNGIVSIYLGNGDGTFKDPQDYQVGTDQASMVAGDFNNDGILDLAVADYNYGDTGSVDILLGNGDGTFQVAGSYGAGKGPQTLTMGDVNNDGNVDLLVTNYYSSDISLLQGNGDGTFQPEVRIKAGATPRGVALADLTGDGNQDLIAANIFSNDVSILFGNGDGTFQTPVNIPAGKGPGAVAVDDFNGDGVLDLAVTNYFDDTLTVFLGNGDGTFHNAGDFTTHTQATEVLSGDFNRDGFPDLAVADSTGNQLQVLINAADWSGPHTRAGIGSLDQRPADVQPLTASASLRDQVALAVMDSGVGAPLGQTQAGADQAGFAARLAHPAAAALPKELLDVLINFPQ
jgi:hypothetical protein